MKPMTSIVAAVAAITLTAAAATGGSMFRVEFGSTAALGMDKKVKDFPKKLVVAVRGVVCEDLRNVKISGTAEGLVNGKRTSLPLTLIPIDPDEAIYAIGHQWPEGTWVLHLKGSCSNPKAEASSLVAVTNGTFVREKSTVMTEPATKKQVDDALASLSRSQS